MKQKYIFDGAIMSFDKVIEPGWSASTFATSLKQARNFLTYRYKKEHNLSPRASIKLSGRLEAVS